MSHICIVTPDSIGPACFPLARHLAGGLGHRVTILFTGPVEAAATARKTAGLDRSGIEWFTLDDLPPEPEEPCHGAQPLFLRSLRVHWWLSERRFDQIYFQDRQANGFIPIQAKRCGLAYGQTLLTCILHSPTEWIQEGSRQFVLDAAADMLLAYAERYAARHADITIALSQQIADWCAAQGWDLGSPAVLPPLGDDPPPCGPMAIAARDAWARVATTPLPHLPQRQVGPQDVTVCIAHFNYGRYLPSLLASLERQTAQGFEVVVVDDGSTDAESRQVFQELRHRYRAAPRWRFEEKANGGIGETRNHAVSLATGDYVVFMDADNEAEPCMIEVMCRAMAVNHVDCLTCQMRGFTDHEAGQPREILFRYLPTGPCLEAGIFNNCFGDANFIVRTEAFRSVGGFSLQRNASNEDWEFLARLSLRGFRQDVIPEPLFLYRLTPGGFSRITSRYLNHMRVVSAYDEFLPDWGRRLLRGVFATVNPSVVENSKRPGVLRRLEQSIRKRRKALAAKLRRRAFAKRPSRT